MISVRELHKMSGSMRESKPGAKVIYSTYWARTLTHRIWTVLVL